MKKTLNKTKIADFATYIGVVIAFIVMNALMNEGMLTRSMKGQLVPICCYIVMAVSLNLTVGILGELSLGHAGFMSVGAFTGVVTAMSLQNAIPSDGVRLALAIVMGAIFAGIAGTLVGIPVLRLHGDYLAIVTLAFGEIIKELINCLIIGHDENGLHIIFNATGAKTVTDLGLTETGTHYADSDYSPSTGLDHIKQLGVTAVELSGVCDAANAFAVNLRCTTNQENAVSELRQLINKIEQMPVVDGGRVCPVKPHCQIDAAVRLLEALAVAPQRIPNGADANGTGHIDLLQLGRQKIKGRHHLVPHMVLAEGAHGGGTDAERIEIPPKIAVKVDMDPTDDILQDIVFHKGGIGIDGGDAAHPLAGNADHHDSGGMVGINADLCGGGFQLAPIGIFRVKQVDNPALDDAALIDGGVAAAGFFYQGLQRIFQQIDKGAVQLLFIFRCAQHADGGNGIQGIKRECRAAPVGRSGAVQRYDLAGGSGFDGVRYHAAAFFGAQGGDHLARGGKNTDPLLQKLRSFLQNKDCGLLAERHVDHRLSAIVRMYKYFPKG